MNACESVQCGIRLACRRVHSRGDSSTVQWLRNAAELRKATNCSTDITYARKKNVNLMNTPVCISNVFIDNIQFSDNEDLG